MHALYSILLGLHTFTLASARSPEAFEVRSATLDEDWIRIGKTDPNLAIELTVPLLNQHEAALEERALAIATPYSGHYRKHLTAEELAQWIKPYNAEHVEKWLSSHGIQSTRKHEVIEANTTIGKAQTLLKATYFDYHNAQGQVVSRVEEYFVPHDIASLIHFVHPTVNFPHKGRKPLLVAAEAQTTHKTHSRRAMPPGEVQTKACGKKFVTPACFKKKYRVDFQPPTNTNVSVEAFLPFLGRNVNLTDVDAYLEKYSPAAFKAQPKVSQKGIPKSLATKAHDDTEEQLDVEMLLGVGWPLKVSYTYLNGNGSEYSWGRYVGPFSGSGKGISPKKLHRYEQPYIKYLHTLTYGKFVPSAMTMSEGEYEYGISPKYARYLCGKFRDVSMRGCTLLNASGDQGSTARRFKNGTVYLSPEWPSSCPWQTTVGATQFINETEFPVIDKYWPTSGNPGVFVTGGGFGLNFGVPKWQENVVKTYLNKHHIPENFSKIEYFNPSGRGYPDVSLVGWDNAAYWNGHDALAGGTSASSPLLAAMIGYLNAYEQSKGRPPLGFLNPWFYSNTNAFNNIYRGGGTNEFSPSIGHGYPVSKGWDAVTGLGSIKFDELIKSLDHMAANNALA